MRGRHTVARLHQRGLGLLADDIIAQLHTLVADEHRRSGDELPDLVLTLAAEGAVEGVFRIPAAQLRHITIPFGRRSEEHTSELQSLMRITYAVFCLNKT